MGTDVDHHLFMRKIKITKYKIKNKMHLQLLKTD